MKPNASSAAVAVQTVEQTEVKKPIMKVLPPDKEEPKQEPTEKAQTIDDLKNRAAMMVLLSEKHNSLLEKKRRLERFAIAHDKENAQITVVDANGEEFISSNPKSIGQLIAIWKTEFSDAIKETEAELRIAAQVA